MKNNLDKLFRTMNSDTVRKIAEDHPTGSKAQRDRIFNEIERRLKDSSDSSGDAVKGVEIYRPKPYLRFASAAAALLIAAGAAGGGYVLLSRKNSSPERPVPAVQPDNVTVPADGGAPGTYTGESAPAEKQPAAALTEDELKKIVSDCAYSDFRQISMECTCEDQDAVSYQVIRSDHTSDTESLTCTYGYSEDHLNGSSDGAYAMFNNIEMFACNGVFIQAYDLERSDLPRQFEIRELDSYLHDRNANSTDIVKENSPFLLGYPGEMFKRALLNNDFEVTGTVEHCGRACTVAHISEKDNSQGYTISVDSQTGIILDGTSILNGQVRYSYTVSDIRFDDDAQLPPDGAYIKKRLEGCESVSAPESDAPLLSRLEESPVSQTADEGEETEPETSEPATDEPAEDSGYEVNSKGQTYGHVSTGITAENLDVLPDLFAAGINGGHGETLGYINTREFLDTFYDCEQAFDMQTWRNNISDTAVAVDVTYYNSEGEPIGTLTLYTEQENVIPKAIPHKDCAEDAP